MNEVLPIVYLSGIVIFLGGLAVFLFLQIIKTRRTENRFYKLQKKLQNEKIRTDYYHYHFQHHRFLFLMICF